MADLHDLSALEQAAAVRTRQVSPSDLVEHYLDRIDRLSDAVGAYVTVAPELA
jgi:amidase